MHGKRDIYILILLTALFSYLVQAYSSMPSFLHQQRFALRARTASTGNMSFSSRSKYSTIYSSHNILPLERPPDPSTHSDDTAYEAAMVLQNWMKNKTSILCLTGAGMSTESGIPDYRGHKGSYFNGHKPVSLIILWYVVLIIARYI